MAKIVDEYFACDFCTVFCGHSYAYRQEYYRARAHEVGRTWFLVYSGPGKEARHACVDCGHIIHFLLDRLGIPHDFVCHEYGENHRTPGEIRVL